MKSKIPFLLLSCFILQTLSLTWGLNAESSDNSEELAKKAQNPIAAMISVPFQDNMNFNAGAKGKVLNVLNIQPVIPFHLSPKWNLITRTIMPVISQPGVPPLTKRQNGIGDTSLSLFLSPISSGKITWGIGPILQVPTSSRKSLGSRKWAAGPTGVALMSTGPWLFGALINNM